MSDEATRETQALDAKPWISPDGAVLIVVGPDGLERHLKLPGPIGTSVRVGKAPDNDLVLDAPTISRHHLELVRTEGGLVARDLDSRNGTFIGGTRIREVVIDPGTLMQVGEYAMLVRVDIQGAVVPASASSRFGLAIGQSLGMRRVFGLLERVAPSDASVLLIGETGTGKDVLARSLHMASKRASGPFEVVDCGALAPSLVESEFFGHEKGAFTGAIQTHEGAFERCRGGTLFLDEIGELPLELQPKLLRVLESREIRRLGGKRTLNIDVRVVAATTRDLEAEVRAGRFRQDLYFRLAVVTARVPPLRERTEDIALISDQMLGSFGGSLSLDPRAIAQLRSYPWPGNVRELRNVLERGSVLAHACGQSAITALDLGAQPSTDGPVHDFVEGISYRDARTRAEHAFERQFVAWILGRHGGNIAAAARAAQMDRKYLGDLARKHGVKA